MSPVFLPPAVVSQTIQAEEAAIFAAEGSYHVNGLYFACASDANIARRVEAERRVDARARQRHLMNTCPWCKEMFTEADEPVVIGLRQLHPAGADQFDANALIVVRRATGDTFAAIGREFGIAHERVRQIIVRAYGEEVGQ